VDAKIKITDFGLSRLFVPIHEQENRDRDGDGDKRRGKKGTGGEEQQTEFPSMKELDAKVAQFFEGGVLSRERLRGTVGYMSPELILMGHCSKATDVFAAGVVLYILLCGRPPFQSKSNREVLEKTCRGQYSISGAQVSLINL
jgi:serine/threonine protein kinase